MNSTIDRKYGSVSSAMHPPQSVNQAKLTTTNAAASIISKQVSATPVAPTSNGMVAKNSGVIDLTDEEESKTAVRKSVANSANGFVSLAVSSVCLIYLLSIIVLCFIIMLLFACIM